MNTETCTKLIKELNQEKDAKIKSINTEYDIKKNRVLNLWAVENARFAIGDIIGSRGIIIKVESIRGYFRYTEIPIVQYIGVMLTKKLEPRKDNQTFTFYDNGIEITKIK